MLSVIVLSVVTLDAITLSVAILSAQLGLPLLQILDWQKIITTYSTKGCSTRVGSQILE